MKLYSIPLELFKELKTISKKCEITIRNQINTAIISWIIKIKKLKYHSKEVKQIPKHL